MLYPESAQRQARGISNPANFETHNPIEVRVGDLISRPSGEEVEPEPSNINKQLTGRSDPTPPLTFGLIPRVVPDLYLRDRIQDLHLRDRIPDLHLRQINSKVRRGVREAALSASAAGFVDWRGLVEDKELDQLGGSGCREGHMSDASNSAERPSPSRSASSVGDDKPLAPAVLVYHESARSIVFRDHLRRQASSTSVNTISSVVPPGSRSRSRSRPRTPIKGLGKKKLHGLAEASDEEGAESDSSAASGSSRGSRGSRGSKGSRASRSRRHRRNHSHASQSSDVGLPLDAGSQHDTIDSSRHSVDSYGTEVIIGGFTPKIDPLPKLDLTQNDEFAPLLESDPDKAEVWAEMSEAEREVVEALRDGFAVVKTISNTEWTSFLNRFLNPVVNRRLAQSKHEDRPPPEDGEDGTGSMEKQVRPFNSFVSSTSLLPSNGKKMRCYGSTKQYVTGVVFELPRFHPNGESEDEVVKRTRTWGWQAGYSAKTEFNIDMRGNLINGREEALVSLAGLRRLNHSYLHDEDYGE